MSRPTCGDAGGRKADGSQCGTAIGLSDAGLCVFHDPLRTAEAEERLQGARAGRRAAKVPALPAGIPDGPPKTLEDAVTWSAWAIHAVSVGVIDVRTCREITYGANVFKGVLEKRILQKRNQELVAKLAEHGIEP